MITEDDVRGYYAAMEVSAESERRVISAALDAPTSRPQRRHVVVAAGLASAAVVAGAIVLVAVRGTGSSDGSGPSSQAVAAVIPPQQPDTLNGAVLDNGHPVAGATVTVTWADAPASLPPTGSRSSMPAVLRAVTDAHGSFAIDAPRAPFVFRMRVATTDGRSADWPRSSELVDKDSAGQQLVFDLGRRTVTVNGKTSTLAAPPPTVGVAGALELVGGPAGTKPRGVSGVVYAFGSKTLSGKPIWTGKTLADGHFTARLTPGTYYFAGKSPDYNGGSALCVSDAVRVEAAAPPEHVAVACGIN